MNRKNLIFVILILSTAVILVSCSAKSAANSILDKIEKTYDEMHEVYLEAEAGKIDQFEASDKISELDGKITNLGQSLGTLNLSEDEQVEVMKRLAEILEKYPDMQWQY